MNTGLITRYTGALYTAPEFCRPRYDEFRDMFSEGQLKSKLWLVRELAKHTDLSGKKVAIAGSWFGTLAFLLSCELKNKDLKFVCIDIDKRCAEFIRHLLKEDELENIKAVTSDMFDYSYSENVIINTSCEHIQNLNDWLNRLPSQSLVVLQSNNFVNHPEHVNCVKSIEEFNSNIESQITEITFAGENNLGIYSRYMIIGKKK